MKNDYINKIVEIGKKGVCNSRDLDYFSENLPDAANKELFVSLRRKYKISIAHITRQELLSLENKIARNQLTEAQKKTVSLLIDLIKGYHLIENKFGGFGSATSVQNLFGSLIELDSKTAIELYNWIANNGGNYYIENNVTYEESKKREQEAVRHRADVLSHNQKTHAESVARKKRNIIAHAKVSIEAKKLYKKFQESFKKMNDKQLIESFNKNVKNAGWVSARAQYHAALCDEFKKRGLNFSSIGKKYNLSFNSKIKLIGKKIVIDRKS